MEAAREALGLREVVVVRDQRTFVLSTVGLLVAAATALSGFLLTRGGSAPPRPSTKPTLAIKTDSLQEIDPKNRVVGRVRVGNRVGPRPTDVAVGEGGVWVIVHPQ